MYGIDKGMTGTAFGQNFTCLVTKKDIQRLFYKQIPILTTRVKTLTMSGLCLVLRVIKGWLIKIIGRVHHLSNINNVWSSHGILLSILMSVDSR